MEGNPVKLSQETIPHVTKATVTAITQAVDDKTAPCACEKIGEVGPSGKGGDYRKG